MCRTYLDNSVSNALVKPSLILAEHSFVSNAVHSKKLGFPSNGVLK